MKALKISLITCCYNAAPFLDDCLASVQRQKCSDFEHIVVDDGSTDQTWSLIQQYQNRDSRVRAFHKSNTGLTDSLNFAVSKAKAPLIACLDADDIALPTRLNEQLSFFSQNPDVVLLGTGFVEIDAGGNPRRTFHFPEDHSSLLKLIETFKSYFPHSSVMFRSDVFRKTNGYNPRFRKSQDCDLWLRLSQSGKIACLSRPLTQIRKHESSVSFSVSGFSQRTFGFAAITSHFRRKWAFSDPTLWRDKAWFDYLKWIQTRLAFYEPPEYFSFKDNFRNLLQSYTFAHVPSFLRYFLNPSNIFRFFIKKTMESYLPKKLARKSLEIWS